MFPQKRHDVGMPENYRERFQHALERTSRLGLTAPAISFETGLQLSRPESLYCLKRLLQNALGDVAPERIAGQCAPLSDALCQPIESILGRRAYFTLGWYRDGPREVFRMSERDIQTWLLGNTSGRANFHAWITLSTMEIIDYTLLTTIGVVTGNNALLGEMVVGHPDTLKFEYHPMLVGNDVLYRARWIREVILV